MDTKVSRLPEESLLVTLLPSVIAQSSVIAP